VAFSVEPSSIASGTFVPSIVIPNATTQTWSAKCTPSTMKATRSSPDRSAAIRSVRAASVALTNRREMADLLVEVDSVVICSPTGSSPTW
jgi:hypothetical protein